MNSMLDSSSRRGSTTQRLRPAPSFSQPVTFQYHIQSHTTRMQKLTKAVKVYRLTVLTLVCVAAGIVIGLVSRPFAHNWTERQFMYVEMPGELYLRLLKLMIIPLLVSNVILSFGSIEGGKLTSHLGKVASFLYLGTNLMAITVAIVVALLICPGNRQPAANKTDGASGSAGVLHFDGHHYFNEIHQSINRYREYHPMFYHTDHRAGQNDDDEAIHMVKQHSSLSSSTTVPISNAQSNNNSSSSRRRMPATTTRTGTVGAVNDVDKDTNDPPGLLLLTGKATLIEPSFVVPGSSMATDIGGQPAAMQRVGLNTKLPIDVLLDVLRNMVPDSFVGATLQQVRTQLFAPKELIIGKNGSISPPPSHWPMGHQKVDQANIIGLLAMSVLAGVVLSHMKEASKPVLDLCACVSELSLRIGMIIINLTPFCIMFLLIGQIARARDLSSMAGELFAYSVTVILALIIHGFILLPLIYYLTTKRSPIEFLMGMLEAIVASFATSSSSATMALMLNCLTDLKLNPVIVGAFGPLGSVFNMNGTAIYEAVGAIFIAQTLGVTLPLTSLLLIGFSSAIASLSTSGIPSSGMMTLVIVLNAINLPVLPLSLIYIVDFIIDRFRTVVNVWSGAIVCGLINHICPEHLFEDEMKPEKYREMLKYRGSRATLSGRKSSGADDQVKPQVISVTITPPSESSRV